MPLKGKNTHMIDLLLPISLLFVFAVSAFFVIILAADAYQATTAKSAHNYTDRTVISYLSEKFHQYDENGTVSLEMFQDSQSIVFRQEFENESYATYIYYYDGSLRELFVKEGINVSLDSGVSLIDLDSFSIEEITPYVFRFTSEDSEGEKSSVILAVTTS